MAGTELVIEQTQVHLNGFSLKVPDWPRTGEDSVNNTRTRTASGGAPPYQYSSSDSFVASVDSVTGKVTGNRNGSAVIRVTDSMEAELSYSVEVTNVWRLNINE
ncbi:Ig-like domain-containing protein, partial [Pseudomonas sp. SED1]|uniref:Ig-like domain-containing protein n=1 Tax=Pseudomonas sp. SED1 TaxID=3056845 RepID=UPI0029700A0E